MRFFLFFFFLITTLQADLYDRNKYNLDFRPQDQQHYLPPEGAGCDGPECPERREGGVKEVHPHHPHNLRNCPCDPGDPQCPCEIDEYGNWRRVD